MELSPSAIEVHHLVWDLVRLKHETRIVAVIIRAAATSLEELAAVILRHAVVLDCAYRVDGRSGSLL